MPKSNSAPCMSFNHTFPPTTSTLHSPNREDDYLRWLIYNVFIAPVYAMAVAFSSLFVINALLFVTGFLLCKFSTFLCYSTSIHPFWPIVIPSAVSGFLVFNFAPKRCRLSLSASTTTTSLLLGFLSLWSDGFLAPEWAVSSGTLLGLNAHIVAEPTLLDELIQTSFGRVTTLRH